MTKLVYFTKKFKDKLKKSILPNKKLNRLVLVATILFLENRKYPQLRDHLLAGKLTDYRLFSVSPNCRILYKELRNAYIFEDIGSHQDIYFRQGQEIWKKSQS